MEQLTIFSQDRKLKSLLERLEDCSEYSGECRVLLDKIAELIGAEWKGSDLFYKGTDKSVDMHKVRSEVGFLPKTSMQYRFNAAGIKTIRDGKTVYLEYNGKRIFRPQLADRCPEVVKRDFGIEI